MKFIAANISAKKAKVFATQNFFTLLTYNVINHRNMKTVYKNKTTKTLGAASMLVIES